MYRRFYGFTTRPFGLTPDPSFLYPTPVDRKAFARLTYGVQERKGFVASSVLRRPERQILQVKGNGLRR
jgi:hypothetical protein